MELIPDGRFSLKSAYDFVSVFSNDDNRKLFQLVWKWKGNRRMKLFMLKVANDILITNDARTSRHMTHISDCSRCLGIRETTLHVLRDCPFALDVWQDNSILLKWIPPIEY